jgi:hypothetical protein
MDEDKIGRAWGRGGMNMGLLWESYKAIDN